MLLAFLDARKLLLVVLIDREREKGIFQISGASAMKPHLVLQLQS